MLGSYGVIRAADVEPKDVEVFYIYSESKNIPLTGDFVKLKSTDVLSQLKNPNSTSSTELMSGFYNLKLPVDKFNVKGIYYIYVKPKEIRTTLQDVGTLFSDPTIRGLLIDPNNGFSEDLALVNGNNNLIGYRVEYINQENKSKIPNQFTIITSSNKCEPVVSGGENGSNDISTTYNLKNTGNLMFLTVTPSSESSVNPNYLPFIGSKSQDVIITNTFFNPVMIELEVVEHDLDTLSWEIGGNRVMDVQGSKYTVYNDNNEIYKQVKIYKKQNMDTNDVDFEISEKLDDIDETQDFETIKNK